MVVRFLASDNGDLLLFLGVYNKINGFGLRWGILSLIFSRKEPFFRVKIQTNCLFKPNTFFFGQVLTFLLHIVDGLCDKSNVWIFNSE